MQILIALDDTANLEIGDDLTDASGITGIVIHVAPDHVIIDTALAGSDAQGAQNATNDLGQPAVEQSALDGAQMTKDSD